MGHLAGTSVALSEPAAWAEHLRVDQMYKFDQTQIIRVLEVCMRVCARVCVCVRTCVYVCE